MGLILPATTIHLSDMLASNSSFAPSNYAKTPNINRAAKPLRYYLDDPPYYQGIEPGSVAYVKNSKVNFVRNSCLDTRCYGIIPSKMLCLNPRYDFRNMINEHDILLCKDANIGDSCLFVPPAPGAVYLFSSGVTRLNFRSEALKYYCFAFLKDDYFLQQLDCMTPRGSTIRHAGERFLDCLIPLPPLQSEWVLPLMNSLVKNMAYSEYLCDVKTNATNAQIDTELMVHPSTYVHPVLSRLSSTTRLDAGIYSADVQSLFINIDKYRDGSCGLKDFGFVLKRGPNLAKRDLGRSLFIQVFKKNFNVLVYPSDISDSGYILQSTFIGARNPVWFLGVADILFAAEGTVGKTFTVCDEWIRFTTNFHGTSSLPPTRIPLSPRAYS